MTGAELAAMLERYLPAELLQKPLTGNGAPATKPAAPPAAQTEQAAPAELPTAETLIDRKLGLQYCNDMPVLYNNVLTLFCKQADGNIAKLDDDLTTGNWKDYRINIHALKSTSLTIGCRSLNKQAKELEQSVKDYLADDTAPEQKQQALNYIQEHHADTMALYRQVVTEGKQQQPAT
jgi:HPt (histidine-containing phosphotransfer) domain-containing protein